MVNFKYEAEHYKFKTKDNIFYLTYTGGPITVEVAKELVKKRLELAQGEEVLMIVTVVDLKGMDKGARSYLSSDEGVKGLKAGAIVTDSHFVRHLANVFMKISFSKSKMPAKLFSNEADAIKWLRQF